MKFIKLIIMCTLACVITLAGCSSESGSDAGRVTTTFEEADTIGDAVPVSVGSVTSYMLYASNSSTDIIFPTGNDTTTGTISRKFFMAETEVTNALFSEVLQWARDNGKIIESSGAHNEVSASTVKYGSRELLDLDYDTAYRKISFNTVTHKFVVASGYENYPVVLVNWYGAIMFCKWLTEMRDGNDNNCVYNNPDSTWINSETTEDISKNGYRLPSNEEWEYAARYYGTNSNSRTDLVSNGINGGVVSLTSGYYWTQGVYLSGSTTDYTDENFTTNDEYAWFFGTDVSSPKGNTTSLKPVAGKKTNGLGLYDMSGNVWEWCYTHTSSESIIRSGCWENVAFQNRINIFSYYSSNELHRSVGFRFVRNK